VGDGAAAPAFATVAGLRTTQFAINGEAVVVTNKDSGGWRQLLSGAGIRSVSVSGAGVFTGSAAEARIKASALAGTIDDYRLSFESGDSMTGRFLVTRLDYAGDFNGERSYTLSLESSGAVVAS
jgi:TP901-1 family phage major tail protein